MPTKEIEEALEPKRIIRIFISVFLIFVLSIALMASIRMASNAANTVEATTRDHVWFTQTLEQIKALDKQIVETKTALAAHEANISSRLMSKVWVSSDDRAETQRLTHQLLDLQEKHTSLVRDYNTATESTDSEILGELPRKIELNNDN